MNLNYNNVLKLFAAGIFLLALVINTNVSVNKPFATLSDLVLMPNAQGETDSPPASSNFGYWPNCNGLGDPWGGGKSGYWCKGNRNGVSERLYEAIDIGFSPHVSLGLFKSAALANFALSNALTGQVNVVNTQEYTCDGQHQRCCAVVNKYRL